MKSVELYRQSLRIRDKRKLKKEIRREQRKKGEETNGKTN
jgi:hypothetical protein